MQLTSSFRQDAACCVVRRFRRSMTQWRTMPQDVARYCVSCERSFTLHTTRASTTPYTIGPTADTHNIYDPDVSLKLEYNLGCSTRGNKYKLLNCTFCYDLRIIYIWNSLPNYVVDVSTINQFKARLDKFWMHQDVLHDYTADLTGIGDRSVHVTKDV